MKTKYFLPVLIIITTLIVSACNLRAGTPTPDIVQIAQTSAAQTVAASITQGALTNTNTPAPSPTLISTAIPSPTLLPTSAASPTPPPCDRAAFVSETIPDDTVFAPNVAFTKTWRLKNSGTCAWTTSYALVFDSGDAMGAPAATALTGNVNPGQTVDLAVNLTSPSAAGTYRGNFKLRNASGVLFGLEPAGSAPFWVQIRVGPVAYSFYDNAPSAQWITCDATCAGGGTVITFGGPDTDPDGFVLYQDGEELENGNSPQRTLETHPMWVDDGVISGLYSNYTVQSGDHFKTKLSFLALPGGGCGGGDAIFQVNYKESGTLHNLDSYHEICDGNNTTVDIDLSSLAGHTAQFALVVEANGTSAQDWAIWIDPRIER
jgi:Ig-like domain-containing protein